jgi:WhiB family redox-sensing transcriptional regulator
MALNVEESGAYGVMGGQVRVTRPRTELELGARPAGVPDDWFVDPIRRGVPGVRRTVEDDDDALAWQSDALCAQTDPEAFFPEKGGSTRDAKKICASCEVRARCLEYALKNDERFGIWGGLSERERRKLRKRA